MICMIIANLGFIVAFSSRALEEQTMLGLPQSAC